MARDKAYELRQKNKKELEERLVNLKEEMMTLRVAKATGANANQLSKVKEVRRSIARVKTIMNEQARGQLREFYKTWKHIPLDLRPKQTRAIRRRLSEADRNRVSVRTRKRRMNYPKRVFAVKSD